ncbi:MAG: CvpA family protein [Acidimicrobiia bacterium]
MIDFLLGLAFAALIIRGWMRGFVRESMDLVGIVVGIAIGFRLSGPVGEFLAERFGMSPEISRVIAGVAIFLMVGLAASLVARWLSRVANLPGLRLGNKALGSAVALAWGVFLAILVLSVAVALPLPPSVDEQVQGSAIARELTDPGGLPQHAFHMVAGDQVLEAVVNLEQLLDTEKVILETDQTFPLVVVDPSELSVASGAAQDIYERVNRSRIEAGLDPLQWTEGLAFVGEQYAWEMYTEGFFGHTSPTTGDVGDRVEAAGIPYVLVGENLALAPTAATVHEGLMSSEGHRANILEPDFTKVGIGVVAGPLGLMVVQVFTR